MLGSWLRENAATRRIDRTYIRLQSFAEDAQAALRLRLTGNGLFRGHYGSVRLIPMLLKGGNHDQGLVVIDDYRSCHGRYPVRAACHWPGGDRPTTWHGSFSNLLQRGRAATLRPWHAVSTFFRDPRGGRNFQR